MPPRPLPDAAPDPASDPTPETSPQPQRSLGVLLREVYTRLQGEVYEAVCAAGHPGLRATHSPVLRHLPLEGGRVADLARVTGLAKQSVSYVVEDLVALGYLRIEPDPGDGRARRLVYTPSGQELLGALRQASVQAEAGLAAQLGAQRLADLRDTLALVLDQPATASPATRAGRGRGRGTLRSA